MFKGVLNKVVPFAIGKSCSVLKLRALNCIDDMHTVHVRQGYHQVITRLSPGCHQVVTRFVTTLSTGCADCNNGKYKVITTLSIDCYCNKQPTIILYLN